MLHFHDREDSGHFSHAHPTSDLLHVYPLSQFIMNEPFLWFLLTALGFISLLALLANAAMTMVLMHSRFVTSLQNILYLHLSSANTLYSFLSLSQVASGILFASLQYSTKTQHHAEQPHLYQRQQLVQLESSTLSCKGVAVANHLLQILSLGSLFAIAWHHFIVRSTHAKRTSTAAPFRISPVRAFPQPTTSALIDMDSYSPICGTNVKPVYRPRIGLWLVLLWLAVLTKGLLTILGSSTYTHLIAHSYCMVSYHDHSSLSHILHAGDGLCSLAMAACIIYWYHVSTRLPPTEASPGMSSHSDTDRTNLHMTQSAYLQKSQIQSTQPAQVEHLPKQQAQSARNAQRLSILGILVLIVRTARIAYEIQQSEPVSPQWISLLAGPFIDMIYTLYTAVMFFTLNKRIMRNMLGLLVRSGTSPAAPYSRPALSPLSKSDSGFIKLLSPIDTAPSSTITATPYCTDLPGTITHDTHIATIAGDGLARSFNSKSTKLQPNFKKSMQVTDLCLSLQGGNLQADAAISTSAAGAVTVKAHTATLSPSHIPLIAGHAAGIHQKAFTDTKASTSTSGSTTPGQLERFGILSPPGHSSPQAPIAVAKQAPSVLWNSQSQILASTHSTRIHPALLPLPVMASHLAASPVSSMEKIDGGKEGARKRGSGSATLQLLV
ncbi:hypothetical protein BASA60_001393 [Batrachochytrium salamandrivorans]|nr:hypothetical protein BASA62_002084 [Batrachochytrium salamandrivorans]KAH6583509.1 hypothetical protein BASA60_001393 [Batrachochytrium salamandrivorans]